MHNSRRLAVTQPADCAQHTAYGLPPSLAMAGNHLPASSISPPESGAGPPRPVARVLRLVRELLDCPPEHLESAIGWLKDHRPVHAQEIVYIIDEVLEQLDEIGIYY